MRKGPTKCLCLICGLRTGRHFSHLRRNSKFCVFKIQKVCRTVLALVGGNVLIKEVNWVSLSKNSPSLFHRHLSAITPPNLFFFSPCGAPTADDRHQHHVLGPAHVFYSWASADARRNTHTDGHAHTQLWNPPSPSGLERRGERVGVHLRLIFRITSRTYSVCVCVCVKNVASLVWECKCVCVWC